MELDRRLTELEAVIKELREEVAAMRAERDLAIALLKQYADRWTI